MSHSTQTIDLTSAFYKAVDDGINGLSKGIPFTVQGVNHFTGGILASMYYLILGAPRTGKSSFLYDQFIFNVADHIIAGELSEEDVEIILYSLEIDRVKIAAKAAARYLFLNYKVITDIKTILGLKGVMPKELQSLLYQKDVKEYIDLVKRITTIFTTLDVKDAHNYIGKRCERVSEDIGIDEEGKKMWRFKDPKKKIIVAIDHVALASEYSDKGLKGTIDMISNMVLVRMKNRFGITPVVLQQVNPSQSADGTHKIIYGHADARDSKNTFQDSDICLAIGSPFHSEVKSVPFKQNRYYVMPSVESNGNGLRDRLRLFGIEKDRYGSAGIRVPASYLGEVGYYGNMEPPNELDYEKYEYKEWQKLLL